MGFVNFLAYIKHLGEKALVFFPSKTDLISITDENGDVTDELLSERLIALEKSNNELKKSGSDSKKNVAAAITGMGVNTATDADFATIAQNIAKIGGDTTISAGDILSGKVAYAKGQYVTGNMLNQGAKTATLNCGDYYNIPAGYHNGAGRISTNSLASQTGATAATSDILSGKTAYVNGNKVTGTIPSKAAATYIPSTQNQEIAAGQYLSGKQTIKGDVNLSAGSIKKGISIFGVTGSFTEDGTAGAGDILSGKTAYVNGAKVMGSMSNQGAKTAALNCGGSYIIPEGYHNGYGMITANSLVSQTQATAETGDILSGKTAYVNGNKVTGTIPSKAAATYTPSTQNQEIAAGQYLSGKQMIKGDANLLAENIKKGVTIFGVTGTFSGDNADGRAILIKEAGTYNITNRGDFDSIFNRETEIDRYPYATPDFGTGFCKKVHISNGNKVILTGCGTCNVESDLIYVCFTHGNCDPTSLPLNTFHLDGTITSNIVNGGIDDEILFFDNNIDFCKNGLSIPQGDYYLCIMFETNEINSLELSTNIMLIDL